MSLSRVPGDEELYIGGIFTLSRRAALQAANITHIVSVLRYDFRDFRDWHKYEHCSVQVDDVEDENLLAEFARTNKFIKEGLKSGGGVLVHCAMGKSRSVTICIAYLLSTRPITCPDIPTALALIRRTRPHAEPNSGFVKQLELFKAMGCPEDVDAEPMYQRWLYRQEVATSLAVGKPPERLRFEDEEDKKENKAPPNGEREKELRCRKCRRTLATREYLLPHPPISTAATITAPNVRTGPIDSPSSTASPLPVRPPCQHHFIQPLSWMRPTLSAGGLSGRLECPNPKCAQLVGRYAWQGFLCSCGQWVVPAFSLAVGKVDEFFVGKGAGAAPGVRMPPGVKESLQTSERPENTNGIASYHGME